MGKQAPVFQENGPYKAYTNRHKALRQRGNKLLMVTALPALGYFLTENGLFLIAGLVYLFAVLWVLGQEKRKLFQEYTELQKRTFAQLESSFRKEGLELAHSGFGYLATEADFRPVFLIQHLAKLYIYENPFIKQCIYGVRDKMVYLLDLKPDIAACRLEQIPVDQVELSDAGIKHQELLRQEAMKRNKYLIIEFPIYQKIFEKQMDFGAKFDSLSMGWLLESIKKEQMYAFDIGQGERILIPAHVTIKLGFYGIDDKEES